VRENIDGTLYSLVHGRLAAGHVDPIEKKPLFNFLPGSRAYSVATVGCNLSCPFCQNHELSFAMRPKGSKASGYEATAGQVAAEAKLSGCASLCFTYSEPTIFFEYMVEMASAAREKGLRNALVSNGFIESEPRRELAGLLDAANIDLKAFDPATYRKLLKGGLEPVLETIRELCAASVWVEVTTLVIPQMNDSERELSQIAEFIASVSTEIPWHVSRFFPRAEFDNRRPTDTATLMLALEAGRRAGLAYVYAGNLPGDSSESTICPGCGEVAIERWGYRVSAVNVTPRGHCNSCGALVAGVFN
jgi:pyruvate formate lyase activating enzyme